MKGLTREGKSLWKGFSEAMSGPTPMSPSTSPAGVVSSSGALDAGTNPVPSMSGPTGPPVTYGPVRPIGASGPSVDPLQGSGDPWGRGQQENPGLSFAPVSSATVIPLSPDGSGNSSGTWQTGQSATASTPVSTATFGMPPGFLDVSGQPASGAAVPLVASNMDPVVLQMMRQQMLLTQSMMDFMTRSAQSTVPPMPGAQVPASSGQGASSGSAPSEKLTMDTKWIPAAPLPDWKSWSSRARELAGFKGWLEKFASWLCLVHDSYAAELKEALDLPYPVVIVNQDQAIRSRRLFHLLQQSFSGYSRLTTWSRRRFLFMASKRQTVLNF